jgi:CubicO group peptidase (beta-lactamase class C family)
MMRLTHTRAAAAALCLILPAGWSTPARQRRAGRAGSVAKRLDEFVSRHAAYGFSGAVLVADRGRVLLHKGYGRADRGRGVPNTAQTVFPLGSITKQLTAAAVYKLEAKGRLKVGDPIGKYLRGVPTEMAGVTILHLLTHSAGISRDADSVADAGATRGEFVASVLRVPPASRPGERYSYSNAGYGLLAAVVEEVTGRTFESYLRGELFRPAGLSHTGWRPEFDSRLFARGYQEQFSAGSGEATFPPVASWRFLGSGSVVGTVGDLYRWNEALYGEAVLTAAAREKLFKPAFDDYVNGWWTTKTRRGEEVSYSDGDFPGYQITLARLPARRAAVIIAVNNDAGWGRRLSLGLQDVLAGETYELPPAVVRLDAGRLSNFAGRYGLPSGATFEVRASDGALLVGAAGQEAVSALAGVAASEEARLAAANSATAELAAHLRRGDFDWLKSVTEFQSAAPLERLRGFWERMLRGKGGLKNVEIVGTTPARGGRTQTVVRFDLERGSEFWLLLWQGGKLRGWDVDTAAPGLTRFLPVSPEEFASLDVATGRVTRIRFSTGAGGRVAALSTAIAGEEKRARRIQ